MGNAFSRNDSDNNAPSLIHKGPRSQEQMAASRQSNHSDSQAQNYLPISHADTLNSKSTTRAGIHSFSESQRNLPSPADLTSPSRFPTSGPRPSPNKGDNAQDIEPKDPLPHKCIECGKGFRHKAALLRHRILHPLSISRSVTTPPAPSAVEDSQCQGSAYAEPSRKGQVVPWGISSIWGKLRPSRRHIERDLATDSHRNIGMVHSYSLHPNSQDFLSSNQPVELTGRVTISPENWKNPISGGFSLVYLGELDGGRPVAVKVPQIRETQKMSRRWYPDVYRRSNREVDTGHTLSHRNINEFLGFSKDFSPDGFPAIISAWCERGTIRRYLVEENPPLHERIRLARDLATGVQYLHQQNLVHGDIKPTNALVDYNRVARLCDLGCVQPFPGHGPRWMVTKAPYSGTPRYKAQELFVLPERPRPQPTAEGDIYALGCLLLEIVENIWTFDHIETEEDLKDAILKGEYPGSRPNPSALPAGLADEFWDLLGACWGKAAHRPTIHKVLEVLNSLSV